MDFNLQGDNQNAQPTNQAQPQRPPEQQAPAPASAPDPDYARFEQYLKSYLGADPAMLRQALVQNQNNTVELQRQRLRDAWGEQYAENYALVEKELQEIAKSDPQRAQALANADGALLLYRAKQYEQLSTQGNLQQGGLNRSSTPAAPAAQNFQFTASQIREMPESERRANHQAIAEAYRQGLVDRNS